MGIVLDVSILVCILLYLGRLVFSFRVHQRASYRQHLAIIVKLIVW